MAISVASSITSNRSDDHHIAIDTDGKHQGDYRKSNMRAIKSTNACVDDIMLCSSGESKYESTTVKSNPINEIAQIEISTSFARSKSPFTLSPRKSFSSSFSSAVSRAEHTNEYLAEYEKDEDRELRLRLARDRDDGLDSFHGVGWDVKVRNFIRKFKAGREQKRLERKGRN